MKKIDRHDIYGKEVVLIFDECHRSQFGQMHAAITRRFKKYCIFGFTGTPIFAVNVSSGGGLLKTTEDVFGDCLHTYTIVDAIRDRNVLPFRVDYVRTMKEKSEIPDAKVRDIEREKALAAPERIRNVTSYILENFDRQTKRSDVYSFDRLENISEVVRSRGREVREVRVTARLNGIMPRLNPFDPAAGRAEKFQRILERIKAFFAKFFDVADSEFGA